MIKKFINNIKLSRLSYLLEIIEVRDFKSKIKAYNKIRQMKITKEMGLLILDAINFDHPDTYSDFNISLSLLSLLFDEYHDEYSENLRSIYKKLTIDSKYEILSLLASCSKRSAVELYRDLVIKYGKELDDIPIGTLSLNKDNYDILFPELFKALKFDIKRNNIILLINDFFNAGVVRENDVKKNKKIIQTSLANILKQGVNYKFKKDENIMQNKDYINLRIFLEAVINIEFYISNKDTKNYLEKLLKKKDNQLKLFILENYIKKGKDISKISLNTIARDNLSRYPLYSFLRFYNLERLMPKKYSNNISLSESDLFINFCINNKYEVIPFDMKFLEETVVNDYKYYIYKFYTKYNYNDEIKDPATDYILKNTEIDKKIKENSKNSYIGISGGFNKDIDPSIIEKNPSVLMVDKYQDDYEKVVERLLPKKELLIPIEKIKDKKDEIKEKIVVKDKSKEKFKLFKKKEKLDKKESKKQKRLEKEILKDKQNKIIEKDFFEEKEPTLLRKIFSFNTLLILLCLSLVGSVFVLISYVNGVDILNLKNVSNDYTNIKIMKSVPIHNANYKEINYDTIFKQGQKEYYVLFYNKKEKSIYHNYFNELLDNNYAIYFVDTNKEENKKIFEGNSTGFIIKEDTFLKVNDGEYEFYVVGKTNIIRELKSYTDSIDEKKEEEEKKKKEEAKREQNIEDITEEVSAVFFGKAEKKKLAKITCKKTIIKNIDFYSKKDYNLDINVEEEE